MDMVLVAEPKQVVAPGEVLAEGDHLLGDNAYRIGTKIFSACVGILEVDGNRVFVVPLKGGYFPRVGALVAGRIVDIGLSGWLVEISAAKIPRLIGRKGSMISMLKKETDCQITVGQNGVVMVWGKSPESERVAVEAIYMVEREAHTRGLTDRIREMISRSRVVEQVAGTQTA